MRTRIATASTVVGTIAAAAAGAGPASAAPPPVPDKLTAELHDAQTGDVRGAGDCEGFCIFDGRGFRNEYTDDAGTLSIDSACDAPTLAFWSGRLRNAAGIFADQGITYSPGAMFNYSSVINHCPFPVRLIHDDGTSRTVAQGQWVWDLGAAPFRINDRVRDIAPVA